MLTYKPPELPKVEKFADETLFVSIDISGILEENEIAIAINKYTDSPQLDTVRTRRGKAVECRVLPINYDSTATYIDHKISIQVQTNFGSIRSINFMCRIYK
jgi:hypothetical protein